METEAWNGTDTDLRDYIKVYEGLTDLKFCASVIDSFIEDKDKYAEYIDSEQRPAFYEFNITRRFLKKDKTWTPIQNQLTKIFNSATDLYMKDLEAEQDFPHKYAYEEHRLKMYQMNRYDQFKDHVDVQDHNSARRFVVMFLYLNTVTSGGETNFPKLNHWVAPRAGNVLVFPANWMYRHSGCLPNSGPKFIVGTYCHYL